MLEWSFTIENYYNPKECMKNCWMKYSELVNFNIFEATGEMTMTIKRLFDALKSIPPTSIEAERAFSAVGLFITKLRTRLTDKSINNLSFLRNFYSKK